MSTSMLSSSSSTSMKRTLSGATRDIHLQGVFIHPDHLASGFFADELASSPPSSASSLIGYDDDYLSSADNVPELPTEALTGLALTCGMASDAQEEMHDYFAPRPGSFNPSPFYSDSTSSDAYSSLDLSHSASSSAATTPTCESVAKSPSFSRRSSCVSVYSEVASPNIPATFGFNAFSPPLPAAPRAPSPSRAHPYSRPSKGGAAMMRSISSPVETARQLAERQRAMFVAEDSLDERAVKMQRTKSTASSPVFPNFFSSAGMSRSSSRVPSRALHSPLSTTFGEGWGAALPPRELQPVQLSSFPYTVARPPVSPHRSARAHSFAGIENVFALPGMTQHRNSLPTAQLPSRSPSLGASPSPSDASYQARRRSTLFAFTPILPESPEEVAVAPAEEEPVSSPSMAPSSPPTPRTRLHRAMTS
ncbi:hypothetical protein JCM8097_003281 [Rhodosporidiobolus ruineniae]